MMVENKVYLRCVHFLCQVMMTSNRRGFCFREIPPWSEADTLCDTHSRVDVVLGFAVLCYVDRLICSGMYIMGCYRH